MAISYSILAIEALAAFFIYQIVKYRYLHPLRIYPGPFLASFTNIWTFYFYLKGNLHLIEQEAHKRYGPIVRTGPQSLSFASPKAFDSIYGFNHNFEKGDFYCFARQPATGEYNIFSARTHNEHRDRRKAVGAALTASHVRALKPVVLHHTQHLLSKLQAAQAVTSQGVVNIAGPVHAVILDTFVEIIYGPSISASGEPWTETASGEGVLSAFSAASKFGWGASYIPSLASKLSIGPVHEMLRKPTFNAAGVPVSISALSARARHLLMEEPELITDVQQPSIAKSMLNARHLEVGNIYNECFNLFFAGPGSTTAAVCGCLERLGSEEGLMWQDRIRDELQLMEDPSESKVLQAVIRESMRYSTPFPLAFPREVRPGAEIAIAGVRAPLPSGTIVGANSWIVSHDKETWGADAFEWKPERWFNANSDAEKRALDEKFVAFSKGARGCVGKSLAMLIITQAVVSVLSRWQVRRVGHVISKSWLEMQIQVCNLKLSSL